MDLSNLNLKVIGQTNFSDPSVWYDPSAPQVPSSGFDIKTIAMDVIKPVIQIQNDDGTVFWKTGEFYSPQGKWWLMGLGIVALIGIAAIAAKISSK